MDCKYKRPSLLIIEKGQFGYLKDSYKWCEKLKDEYDITYLSVNLHRKILSLDGVKIINLPFDYPYILRGILFILVSLYYVFKAKGNIIVIHFDYCSVLQRLFPWKKMIIDIRTLSVESDDRLRKKLDDRKSKDCQPFHCVTVISEGVKNKLHHPNLKLLPLGSDIISEIPKDYNNAINILYIGTLLNRNIEEMILGLKLFKNSNPNIIFNVDIVGDGLPGQLEKMKNYAEKLGLKSIVKFHGLIPLTDVKRFFDKCNIGISFVPITDYYNNQPPTKTFEYVMSGLFCIATSTDENKKLITAENGVLIEDNAASVCQALKYFMENRHNLCEASIRNSLKEFTWDNIVNRYLRPVLIENR